MTEQRQSITGPELKAARRAAGLNQTQMAKRVGAARCSVSYWECKRRTLRRREYRYGVPKRMLEVLGIAIGPPSSYALKYFLTPIRARGYGVLFMDDPQQARLDAECERQWAKVQAKATRYRQPCGAKTRKGHPCRNLSEPGRRRCKYHGGLSTGPRTKEGRQRIAEAQRRRWRRARMAM